MAYMVYMVVNRMCRCTAKISKTKTDSKSSI